LALIQEESVDNFNFNNFRDWMRSCFRNDVIAILSWIGEMSTIGRERQKNFLAFALNVLRECLIINYADPDMVRIEGEELDFIKKFAPYITASNCEQMTAHFEKAIGNIERNANPKILLTDLSLKLMELLKQPAKTSPINK
jgi:DNA polymerase-3 subunit delta'